MAPEEQPLKLDIEEEDEEMTEVEVEIVVGNVLMEEDQLNYPRDEEEKQGDKDTNYPWVGDAVVDDLK